MSPINLARKEYLSKCCKRNENTDMIYSVAKVCVLCIWRRINDMKTTNIEQHFQRPTIEFLWVDRPILHWKTLISCIPSPFKNGLVDCSSVVLLCFVNTDNGLFLHDSPLV